MILCPHFPARQCADTGQSSTSWGEGGLSISPLSLCDTGEPQPRHQDRQLPLHTDCKGGVRVRHKPLGSCPVQKSFSHYRRIRDSYFITGCVWRSGVKDLEKIQFSARAARASAVGRTCSVPPCHILQ